jgi:hypothetical protein
MVKYNVERQGWELQNIYRGNNFIPSRPRGIERFSLKSLTRWHDELSNLSFKVKNNLIGR